jgi:hypothetical protein
MLAVYRGTAARHGCRSDMMAGQGQAFMENKTVKKLR